MCLNNKRSEKKKKENKKKNSSRLERRTRRKREEGGRGRREVGHGVGGNVARGMFKFEHGCHVFMHATI
jgi:hypothetical protein